MLNINYDLSINPLTFGYASADKIERLDKDEIYVFDTDLIGKHSEGNALLAVEKFGAELGLGEGIQGQSYALPIKDTDSKILFLKDIKIHVEKFISYAGYCQNYHFLVTKIGCGKAGYTVNDIAPLFVNCVYFKNIHLPKDFITYLQTKYYDQY